MYIQSSTDLQQKQQSASNPDRMQYIKCSRSSQKWKVLHNLSETRKLPPVFVYDSDHYQFWDHKEQFLCFVYLPRVVVANYAETVEMAFNNAKNKEQFLCLAHFPMMVVAKYAEIGEMVVKLKLQTKPCKS